MSIRCVAEQYSGLRFMFRISADYSDEDMDAAARMLAVKCEEVFATNGSNIFNNTGRWKGDSENGRTIEIVRRIDVGFYDTYGGLVKEALETISRYVNVTIGMSCFATVEPTTAYELYELAE